MLKQTLVEEKGLNYLELRQFNESPGAAYSGKSICSTSVHTSMLPGLMSGRMTSVLKSSHIPDEGLYRSIIRREFGILYKLLSLMQISKPDLYVAVEVRA